MSFSALEHKLINHFKSSYGNLENKKVLVSCSGGLDSVVLLHLCNKIKPVLKFSLEVVHFHHGEETENLNITQYRNEALSFCSKLAKKKGILFKFKKSPSFLNSEEECREFRISTYKKESTESLILLGQHKDDLIETTLLRLIRGTGVKGLSSSFSSTYVSRPFLKLFSRKELEEYALENKIDFLEDPSNSNTDYLRNWIRNDWLESLESKTGKKGLSKSLLQLVDYLQDGAESQEEQLINKVIFFEKEGLSGELLFSEWSLLKEHAQKRVIAIILNRLKSTGYTSGQVYEIIKLLKSKSSKVDFCVSNVRWFKDGARLRFSLVKG